MIPIRTTTTPTRRLRVQRGDVVLLPIAFTTGGGGKVRPGLVVQSDHNNALLYATIVAIITKIYAPGDDRADAASHRCKLAGGPTLRLAAFSAVRCEHHVTVATADTDRVIGVLQYVAHLCDAFDSCFSTCGTSR